MVGELALLWTTFGGGWRSSVVGSEGPVGHFDFAAEVPESC